MGGALLLTVGRAAAASGACRPTDQWPQHVTACPARRRQVPAQSHPGESGNRDDAVREAAAAGLSLTRIQKITGVGTTTIMRILSKPPRPRP
jgi:hypothetical protein